MKRKIALLTALVLLLLSVFCACSAKSNLPAVTAPDGELIFEETVSPNKEFTDNDADVVYYIIRVYQKSDYSLVVQPDSNSEFYRVGEYTVDCKRKITKDDISVKWETIGGSTEYSEHDQLSLADVSIKIDDGNTDERIVSFIGRAVKNVAQAVG